MEFQFQPLPSEVIKRPVVPIKFVNLPKLETLGLVDSGALGTRIGAEWAEPLGLDLSEGSTRKLVAGGRSYLAYDLNVRLKVGKWEWNATVSFAEDWYHGYAILGLEGFFDNFVVRIDSQKQRTALTRFK